VCAQYTRPNGVAFSFQVSTNSIEPALPNRSFNLLTKHALRARLADEPEHFGPEVSRIVIAFALTRLRVRLTGAATGPHGAVGGPPCKLQGVIPSADSSEEMNSFIPGNIGCLDLANVLLIDSPFGNQPIMDEFAKPRCRERVELVIENPIHFLACFRFFA
jgi:hypothetical protein